MEILQNAFYQKKLDKDGFVVVPFLNNDKLTILRNLYKSIEKDHPANGKFLHTTFHTANVELLERVDFEIKATIANEVAAICKNYEIFVANFMIKEPGQDTTWKPHQDWTLVDENKFVSLNLWFPLYDVSIKEGCLSFLPGSHKIKKTLRISPKFPSLFEKVMDLVQENLVYTPIKAGEAVLFFHNTLHGSAPNLSSSQRVNGVFILNTKHATKYHYYQDPSSNNKIEQFLLRNYNDFLNIKDLQRPSFLPLHRIVEYDFPQLTAEEFISFYPCKKHTLRSVVKQFLGKQNWYR